MRCHSRNRLACLPVTALHTIIHEGASILFSNDGSSLTVRHDHDRSSTCRHDIFRSQAIHGIASSRDKENTVTARYHLIVWGGSFLRKCILSVDSLGGSHSPRVELEPGPVIQLDDWIVTVVADTPHSAFMLLTAHNALSRLDFEHTATTVPIAQGLQTLLYSGSVMMSDDYCLVASGTIFGEVIFWACSCSSPVSENTRTVYVFTGHLGSVFGVDISESISFDNKQYRFVASCSDDRTIRIWDVSGWQRENVEKMQSPVNDTGFGGADGHSLQLAMAWGHLSRIWAIHFGPVEVPSSSTLSLISRGEDGVCQLWRLELDRLLGRTDSIGNALNALSYDRHHVGKNAWSLDLSSNRRIYTGGADGQVVSRCPYEQHNSVSVSVKFINVLQGLKGCSARTLKHYLVVDNKTIVAITDTGDLVRIEIPNLQIHKTLTTSSSPVTLLSSSIAGGLAFYALADGSLCAYRILTGTDLGVLHKLPSQVNRLQVVCVDSREIENTIYLIANVHGEGESIFLKLVQSDDKTIVASCTVPVPTDFLVTSAYYHARNDILICGSRSGALAVFPSPILEMDLMNRNLVIRHVHGSDAVTSILAVPAESTLNAFHILTTGRDGTFAIHRLESDVNTLSLHTLHRASPPFGPYIEGAYFHTNMNKEYTLLIYGFRSKEFVVWNETDQTQLLSVDCGGAHRSWSYSHCNLSVGLFVWTKAKAFNAHLSPAQSHQIIQPGGHGREIKAAAIWEPARASGEDKRISSSSVLLATGAEDTDIRLFQLTSASLSHVAVLKYHTTGLQALKFSRCGHYLFSSGGVEEFVIWRLSTVPVIGCGAVVVCQLQKNEEDDDARIMAFDVVEDLEDEIRAFTILMAYSNGKVKVFKFIDDNIHESIHLKLVGQLLVGTLCLTQAQIVVVGSFRAMLFGATDGYLRFANLDAMEASVTMNKMHQSNISAMSTHWLASGILLIATGGDDNALSFGLSMADSAQAELRGICVPSAHAAAVTAVAIIEETHVSLHRSTFVVSAGNDQMIRLWRISGLREGSPQTSADLRNVEVDMIVEHATDVADISNVCLKWDRQTISHCLKLETIVVGVGLQIMQLEIDNLTAD